MSLTSFMPPPPCVGAGEASRNERPVLARKTSSRLGSDRLMVAWHSPESSWRISSGRALVPSSTYRCNCVVFGAGLLYKVRPATTAQCLLYALVAIWRKRHVTLSPEIRV